MSELGRVVVQRVVESPEQMAEFGCALSRVLHAGDVVLLEGSMGAGKTTLTRAVAVGLGHDARLVSSPTFVLMNQYQSPGAMAMAHVDAYRMSEDEELGTLGIDRVIVREDQEVDGEPWVVMIEWPGRIARALGQMLAGVSVVRVELEVSAETQRIVTIDAPSGFA
jgi:tRNA threonylcarbamoyladenosine biosynthesis protein TsaE